MGGVEGGSGSGFDTFSGGGFRGEVASIHRDENLLGEVRRLADPSAAEETIHWGRNYLYTATFRGPVEAVKVVVKQFRNKGWLRRADRRLRGSKAERSWRVAKELARVGLSAPESILLAESAAPDGPSFFVSRLLENAVEVRHFFRRLNGDPSAGAFPDVDDGAFLARLGAHARRIHDAGIWYRDLSLGNVLVVPARGALDLYLVDFNRARVGRRLGVYRRTRDICRFPVLHREHREAFLGGYWGEVPSRLSPRWWLYVFSVNSYLFKHALKGRLRRLRWRRRHAHGGSHHPHIPDAEAGASSRDKAVWDYLSDQPHQHATRGEKLAIRVADSPGHLRDLAVVVSSVLPVRRRYRALKESRYKKPVPFAGIGLAVRPWPDDPEAHLNALEELRVGPVLIRLHPWDTNHDDEEELAAALYSRGHELAFSIPQNRHLVCDRGRWRAVVEELAERFTKYGRHFQVGQAINRSKWGVWTRGEYLDLYQEAAEILRRHDEVEVMGPAVIDFEFQVVLALINRRRPGLRFDVVSSLLYVDRRGAPENRHLGFDTVDKVTLLRAIAEVGHSSSDRCWITEVNWPLWEGPHSPAGKTVSVGEEEQADYLARYYLLALGTGLVERVYWWRLVARGYGLVAPESGGSLRRRPAWSALKTLISQVEGATFQGPLPAPDGAFLYHFTRESGELVVGWSVTPNVRATLPRPAEGAVSRDGQTLPAPDGVDVLLGPSPVYFELG
ncbi:MAG: lipopolysaccharide kinase InaA family protein [Thermoanaerobaculales bacterium]